MQCNGDPLFLNFSFSFSLFIGMSTQLENVQAISLTSNEMEIAGEGTESITVTIKDEEEEEGGGGYKRMDLKGESESDKDLIIYSLNESLQIHKEIVERTQNEKDDIEDQFEQERMNRENERMQIVPRRDSELGQLQAIYDAVAAELEAKKLDYQRMESRFHSHVKKKSSETQDIQTIHTQLIRMLSQINNLCVSTIKKQNTEYILNLFRDNTMIQQHFVQEKDTHFLVEKYMMDIILKDIFSTSIHPGVSLNNSFGAIHDWIEKRNVSWAARLKQQISQFVKQSDEQSVEIEQAKGQITSHVLDFLSRFYDNIHLLEETVLCIVNEAFELNLLLKSQGEDTVQMMSISQGTQYNSDIMTAVNEGDHVLFVISPPFAANGVDGFIIPAKVYCV
ncbi:uncharacterized protein EV154DRAFT_520467 [Mucor mucedo]|uniref:uncharacterized protein n=1 Tax=Mucor mucedo TaxID=29922 RepID=UPI00221FB3FE|nr:uncharacterized protein EV154DRAFT_520467 [Mucor mucedo]KAI7887598.1 hypothetical protein EV154DRAFT_520467 [Mucor mucedo]